MKTKRSGLVTTGVAAVGAAALLAGVLAHAANADDGKQIYDKNCQACHGPGGKGDGPAGKMLKPAPGDFATAVKGKGDADIAKVIKEGGKAVGKSAVMPAYGTKLSDEQVQLLVKYVKELASK